MSIVRLLVLGVVRMHGQAHGYAVHRELLAWRVETWTSVRPGSIYHALKQLNREGLLEAVGQEASSEGPSRTLYRLSETGETEFMSLLTAALQSVHFEEFGSGIAFMQSLPRDQVITLLEERHRRTVENHDLLVALGPVMPPRHEPPHTRDLLSLWSRMLASNVGFTEELLTRMRSGEYQMANDHP